MGEVVKHMLAVEFKPETTQDKIDELVKKYAHLQDVIPSIKEFVWGKDLSGKMNHGYTYVFTATFDSMEELNAYLENPLHVEFTKELRPTTANLLRMDYNPTVAAAKSTQPNCCSHPVKA